MVLVHLVTFSFCQSLDHLDAALPAFTDTGRKCKDEQWQQHKTRRLYFWRGHSCSMDVILEKKNFETAQAVQPGAYNRLKTTKPCLTCNLRTVPHRTQSVGWQIRKYSQNKLERDFQHPSLLLKLELESVPCLHFFFYRAVVSARRFFFVAVCFFDSSNCFCWGCERDDFMQQRRCVLMSREEREYFFFRGLCGTVTGCNTLI